MFIYLSIINDYFQIVCLKINMEEKTDLMSHPKVFKYTSLYSDTQF